MQGRQLFKEAAQPRPTVGCGAQGETGSAQPRALVACPHRPAHLCARTSQDVDGDHLHQGMGMHDEATMKAPEKRGERPPGRRWQWACVQGPPPLLLPRPTRCGSLRRQLAPTASISSLPLPTGTSTRFAAAMVAKFRLRAVRLAATKGLEASLVAGAAAIIARWRVRRRSLATQASTQLSACHVTTARICPAGSATLQGKLT